MIFNLATFALIGAAAAAPFSLPDGFPNPSAQNLMQIYKQAGGTLPDTPLPTNLPADAIQALQIIAVNEIFETAYFSNLLDNVTNSVNGYTDLGPYSKQYVVDALTAVRAQEEVHAIGVNAILASAGGKTIGACNYDFPVDNFMDAIALAATFTDLVVGTLATVQKQFAIDGGEAASGLVNLFGLIIGQESEQDGGYRVFQQKRPSAAPILTAGAGTLAFNAVNQLFIVPNSCKASSNVSAINAPIFSTLKLSSSNATPSGKNQTLSFDSSYTKASSSANHIAYISGANAPVVESIKSVKKNGNTATFQAYFPFDAGFANGLTIAALVNSAGPFADATAVANATVAGPGLIEIG